MGWYRASPRHVTWRLSSISPHIRVKNWLEINGRHIARWDRRLEMLAQGAPIDVADAPTSPDYMVWFFSITCQWMTPRGIITAAQYAPATPMMTQFVSILPCWIIKHTTYIIYLYLTIKWFAGTKRRICGQLQSWRACTEDCSRHSPRDTIPTLHSRNGCARDLKGRAEGTSSPRQRTFGGGRPDVPQGCCGVLTWCGIIPRCGVIPVSITSPPRASYDRLLLS